MTLESILNDTLIGGGRGRIQIDQFGEQWRVVVAHFNGRQTVVEDVTPASALRAALIEDERLSRYVRPAEVDPDQLDLEDAIAAADYGDFLG